MVVYCRKNRLDHNRLGITVSTKLGGAVVRNRARRRLAETFPLSRPHLRQGYDIVLVARGRVLTAPFPALLETFRRLCGKLEIWEERL